MQHEIANCIYTKEIYQFIGIQYISFGLTHFSVTLEQPRMSEYLLRKRYIQCHQEDWPVNGMETDDILSDQMQVCRPVLLELIGAFSVAVISDSGDIVGQSVQPYIHHMIRIKVHRNSPFEGRSGYTQILQSRKQEVVHHLIFSGYRLNKFRMRIDMLNQAICIFTHFEEICFLFCRLYFPSAVRTFSVYQLGLCKERLTRCAVHSFIISFVNVSLFI